MKTLKSSLEASKDLSNFDNVQNCWDLWSQKLSWHCYNYHYQNHLSNWSHHKNLLGVECNVNDALVTACLLQLNAVHSDE